MPCPVYQTQVSPGVAQGICHKETGALFSGYFQGCIRHPAYVVITAGIGQIKGFGINHLITDEPLLFFVVDFTVLIKVKGFCFLFVELFKVFKVFQGAFSFLFE